MSTWMSKNKWGLMALVPLLLIALAAASSRVFSVYLPWEAPSPIASEKSVVFSSTEQDIDYPEGATYQATFTPVAVARIDSYKSSTAFRDRSNVTAAPGAQLWRIAMRIEADPNLVMTGCAFMVIGDDGVRYGATGAKLEDGKPAPQLGDAYCTPPLQLGPTADLKTNEWQAPSSDSERSPKWDLDLHIALPEGVSPATLIVDMSVPGRYWTVPLPAA